MARKISNFPASDWVCWILHIRHIVMLKIPFSGFKLEIKLILELTKRIVLNSNLIFFSVSEWAGVYIKDEDVKNYITLISYSWYWWTYTVHFLGLYSYTFRACRLLKEYCLTKLPSCLFGVYIFV